jgi:DNA-binding transcriptional regulator YdaS (Cro superfamily)
LHRAVEHHRYFAGTPHAALPDPLGTTDTVNPDDAALWRAYLTETAVEGPFRLTLAQRLLGLSETHLDWVDGARPVPPEAVGDINRAFRRRSPALHPDRHPAQDAALYQLLAECRDLLLLRARGDDRTAQGS